MEKKQLAILSYGYFYIDAKQKYDAKSGRRVKNLRKNTLWVLEGRPGAVEVILEQLRSLWGSGGHPRSMHDILDQLRSLWGSGGHP